MESDVLYTVEEVSKQLKCNKSYVYSLIKTGLLKAIKLKSIRVRKEALRDFLEKYEGYDLSDLQRIEPLYLNIDK